MSTSLLASWTWFTGDCLEWDSAVSDLTAAWHQSNGRQPLNSKWTQNADATQLDMLHGYTHALIAVSFSTNPETTVFLISLKAGGVALNLTEASRVFIW